MGSDDEQRKIYSFFRERYRDGGQFKREDLEDLTGWERKTTNTYLSKQFKGLLSKTGRGQDALYQVSESFLRYPSFGDFKDLVTQVRRVAEDYTLQRYHSVVIYDFFMPLSNEDLLRRALDALFFKDTLKQKLRRQLDGAELAKYFPILENEVEDDYVERILSWVDSTFGGYSIMHVSGRFKVPPLLTASDAGELYQRGGRYLVDETTAVVRFIFPCGSPVTCEGIGRFESEAPSAGTREVAEAEASKVSWFFWVLFVESIVRVVNGQDQIWMLESGLRSQLHVWST